MVLRESRQRRRLIRCQRLVMTLCAGAKSNLWLGPGCLTTAAYAELPF